MQTTPSRNVDNGGTNCSSDAISRRDLLLSTTVAGAAAIVGGQLTAQEQTVSVIPQNATTAGQEGLLYPQQNQVRNLLDISGLWSFQLDPREEGEAKDWYKALPAPRTIAVPCSWNDLFDDARDYLDLAWYLTEVWVPSSWRSQRVFLRVGSANYAAKVWVNGIVVAEHLGGHLPFIADVTNRLSLDRKNVIAITVENKQLLERVPPAPGPGGGGVAGVLGGFPATTYDFFPYTGLHRPVVLYSVPAAAHIDDVTVVTTIEGKVGVVKVTVEAAGDYSGKGRVRLNDIEADLTFRAGSAVSTLHVPSARFWGPQDPYLYPLTVTLNDGERVTDSYTLDVGIRTVAVQGERLLLNGEPIKLTGFGKHEDFPLPSIALGQRVKYSEIGLKPSLRGLTLE